MAESAQYTRKVEVTRAVLVSPPDTLERSRTATPHQKQHVTWNGPVENLFGYSSEDIEVAECWWLDRIHPEDVSRILESLKQHLVWSENPFDAKSRIWGSDYRFRCASGVYILVSDRAIITRDELGHAVRLDCVVFDKEVRKIERDAHATFLESQNHLAIVANNTPSGIFMMNPEGQ